MAHTSVTKVQGARYTFDSQPLRENQGFNGSTHELNMHLHTATSLDQNERAALADPREDAAIADSLTHRQSLTPSTHGTAPLARAAYSWVDEASAGRGECTDDKDAQDGQAHDHGGQANPAAPGRVLRVELLRGARAVRQASHAHQVEPRGKTNGDAVPRRGETAPTVA